MLDFFVANFNSFQTKKQTGFKMKSKEFSILYQKYIPDQTMIIFIECFPEQLSDSTKCVLWSSVVSKLDGSEIQT